MTFSVTYQNDKICEHYMRTPEQYMITIKCTDQLSCCNSCCNCQHTDFVQPSIYGCPNPDSGWATNPDSGLGCMMQHTYMMPAHTRCRATGWQHASIFIILVWLDPAWSLAGPRRVFRPCLGLLQATQTCRAKQTSSSQCSSLCNYVWTARPHPCPKHQSQA